MAELKKCANEKCGKEFEPYRQRKKYCSVKCCRYVMRFRWRQKHPDKVYEAQSQWWKNNKEKARDYRRSDRAKHLEKRKKRNLEYMRQFAARCPEIVKERSRHQRQLLAEQLRIAAAEFAKKSGWPGDLSLQETEILNVLAADGSPMTVWQIGSVLGQKSCYKKAIPLLADRRLIVHFGPPSGPTCTWTLSASALAILEERALCELQRRNEKS